MNAQSRDATTEQLLHRIAELAGAAEARHERAMLDAVLELTIDHFGLEALGVWLRVAYPAGYRRHHSVARGGRRLVEEVFLSSELFDAGHFDEDGFVVVEASQARELFPGSAFVVGSSSLLVPLGDGTTSEGFLGLPADWASTVEDWPDEVVTAARAIGHVLGQALSRIHDEGAHRLRSKVSRILAATTAMLDKATTDMVPDVAHGLLEDAGELLDASGLSVWEREGDGLARVAQWDDPGAPAPVVGYRRIGPDNDLLAQLQACDDSVLEVRPGADSPDPSLRRRVGFFAPVVDPDGLVGAVSVTFEHATSATALEAGRAFVAGFAERLAALRSRVRVEREEAHRLEAEDLLRRFATRLAATPAGDPVAATEALGWFSQHFGIDHVSLWQVAYRPDEGRADLRLQYGAVDGLRFDLAENRLSLPPAPEESEETYVRVGTEFDLAEGSAVARRIRSLVSEPGPRRAGLFGEHRGGRLLVMWPGDEPMSPHVRSVMHTVLSILTQHDARVRADQAFLLAFEASPLAMFTTDGSGFVTWHNSALAEVLRRGEDLVGTRVEPERDEPGLDAERENEAAFRRGDGSIVWLRTRRSTVEVPGYDEPVTYTYAEDVTESRRARRLLVHQAEHDHLTSLPNRRAFASALETREAAGEGATLLLIDLDRFKLLNDSMGHGAGDRLLVTCADRIRLSLRAGDTAFRLGGDEFAVVLRPEADRATAGVVAHRLLDAVSRPFVVDESEVYPTASIGIAASGDELESLLGDADAAMYAAKSMGRNRVVYFDQSMRDATADRMRTEAELRRAIEERQLEVHYQPEVLLASRGVVGVEALVRWRHPTRGLLVAAEFVEIAEESGLIVEIGRLVLAEATGAMARWVEQGIDIVLRINLSAVQLRSSVVDEVASALSAAGLPPSSLCVEITETAVMSDIDESGEILRRFREFGVLVAIDDFGTGFSSLAYLKRLPVDVLKIDRSFVDGVADDPDDRAIVRSIIALAASLRLDVVAEGIEDEETLAGLLELGCRRGQGYLWSRPVPADELEVWLESLAG